MHLTHTEIWIFIVLYSYLLWMYGTFLMKTVKFLKKDKPKGFVVKWKYSYPIAHLIDWKEKKTLLGMILLIILVVFLVGLRGNIWADVLTAGFFFSVMQLHREFKIHAFLMGDRIVVWSVYKEKKEKEIFLNHVISKEQVILAEWKRDGCLIETDEGKKKIYIQRKEQEEIKKLWNIRK